MNRSTTGAAAWLDATARHSFEDLRLGLSLVAKHPRRGPTKSYDGETRRVPENPHSFRSARVEPVPGSLDAVQVVLIEGQCEDRLTMSLASLGERTSETGLVRALSEIIGDPPGWSQVTLTSQNGPTGSLLTPPHTSMPRAEPTRLLRGPPPVISPASPPPARHLSLVPPPAETSTPQTEPAEEEGDLLDATPRQAICVECGHKIDHVLDAWRTGEEQIRYDLYVAPCPKCGKRSPPDEPPPSGVRLKGKP